MKSLLTVLFCISAVWTSAETGDARAARLLDAMGGAEAWAQVNAVMVEATHHEDRKPLTYRNLIVNDFAQSRVRFEAHAPGWDRWEVITADRAEQRRDQDPVESAQPDRAAGNRAWWHSNVYRTLKRLANGATDLTCVAVGEDRLEIHQDGEPLNWFRLLPDGRPVQFGVGSNATGTLFGPLRDDAETGVRYPAWGTSPDGAWQYEIERFVVNPPLSAGDFIIPEPPVAPTPPELRQP